MDEGNGALAGRGGGGAREDPRPRWPRKQGEDRGYKLQGKAQAREGSRLHAGVERGKRGKGGAPGGETRSKNRACREAWRAFARSPNATRPK